MCAGKTPLIVLSKIAQKHRLTHNRFRWGHVNGKIRCECICLSNWKLLFDRRNCSASGFMGQFKRTRTKHISLNYKIIDPFRIAQWDKTLPTSLVTLYKSISAFGSAWLLFSIFFHPFAFFCLPALYPQFTLFHCKVLYK